MFHVHLPRIPQTFNRTDLDDFVACYNLENRHERVPTWFDENLPPPGHLPEGGGVGAKGRWRAFSYDELIKRDKLNLDIFWLKDEALEDSASPPHSDLIVRAIADDLGETKMLPCHEGRILMVLQPLAEVSVGLHEPDAVLFRGLGRGHGLADDRQDSGDVFIAIMFSRYAPCSFR